MISVLLDSYNIQQFPAVVVGSKVFQGHTPVETLLEAICRDFSRKSEEMPEECSKQ